MKTTNTQKVSICKQCGKEYDKNETMRVYGTHFVYYPFCSAQCYTKANTQPSQTDNTVATEHTPGNIKVSNDGNDIETNHEDSPPTGICSMYAYEWADKDAARIVECWNNYDQLKRKIQGNEMVISEAYEVNSNLKAENEALKEANRELLEALKEIYSYNKRDSLTGAILKNIAKKVIAKHSPKN